MEKNRKVLLVFLVIALLAVGWIALTPVLVAGGRAEGTSTAEASTPYGESISIKLGSGTETSGSASIIEVTMPASWQASYQGQDQQNVYAVNDTYKSQEQVTLEYDLTVTYTNVGSIKATVKIKAIDKGTPANFYEYTLASLKSLSGASPINDEGSTQKTISAHLTDVGGSTTDEEVQYQIYAQVTATGSVSGETLTATISYTPFGTLHYVQSSESSTADVTPTVSVAAWVENRARDVDYVVSIFDASLGLPEGSALTVVAILSVAVAVVMVRRR